MGNLFADDKPRPAAADAPDPGDTPYPNLAVVPRRPARPDAQTLQTEQTELVEQRQASQNFDAQLRSIDPILNPTSRPPEPPKIAAASTVSTAPALPTPVASTPIPPPPTPAAPIAAAAVPNAIQTPAPIAQATTLPQFVPPVLAPATVPAAMPATVPPVQRPAPQAPARAARAAPSTAWLIGEVAFGDGSTLLSAESRRTLRMAVVVANERRGAVRITPIDGHIVGPQDGALAPRRMAAMAGELEALGLGRDLIRMEAGGFRNARVSVEF